MLSVLLIIMGLAKGFSGEAQGPAGCANQTAVAHQPAHDPCIRSGGGWNQVGYALIASGVLGLIGAATIRITARR